MSELSRRQTLIVAAGLGSCLLPRPVIAWTDERIAAAILGCLTNRDDAAALGRRYWPDITRDLDPVTPERLCVAIVGSRKPQAIFLAAPPRQRAARLAASVREDFRHGRTLDLDGWLLSRTEAWLLALAACA